MTKVPVLGYKLFVRQGGTIIIGNCLYPALDKAAEAAKQNPRIYIVPIIDWNLYLGLRKENFDG